MRKALIAVLAAAALAAPVAVEAKRMAPEEKLAKLLEGRVAGEPQDCIYLPTIRSTQAIDKTAIVYDAGRTLWVNRPDNGATSLDDDDVLVTRLHSSSLCSIDIVQLQDRTSWFYSGFVALGDFVPYRKVDAGR